MCCEGQGSGTTTATRKSATDRDKTAREMLLVAMRKLCRVGIAAVVATALCVLTLVDMPPQLPEPPTDPPPTPAREPPGTRSIVAYSWARRLALDYRRSRDCGDDGGDRSGFFDGTPEESRSPSSSSSASNASRVTSNSSISINSSNSSSSSSSSWSGGSSDSKSWWLETIPRRLFLYSAHLDIRVAGYPSVRVIGVKREPAPPLLSSGKLFCTIWHEDSEGRTRSFSMEALVSYIWLDEWGGTSEGHTGILVNCHLPRSMDGRLRVHVGPTFCHQNPSHSLLVNGPATSSAASDSAETTENKTKTTTPVSSSTGGGGEKNRFTLCIKGLDFDEDISERLVAFVELNRILGAGTMYVYVFHVHANVSRVLRMYEKSNVVRWFPLSLPGDLPKDASARRRLFAKDVWMKRRMELIPYNHCFYENLYSSEFVVPIDIDETIIPVRRRTWSQLMADERSLLGGNFENYASYAVRNVYFFPEFQRRQRASEELRSSTGAPAKSTSATGVTDGSVVGAAHHYLDTVRTAAVSPEGDSVKSFVSTKRALTVHNHYALTTLDPTTRRAHHFDPRDALKHHHRACDNRHLDCDLATQDLLVDESATRYADELATRVKIALARLDEMA